MNFHERIKQARIKRGLTQADVSEEFQKLGVPVKPYAISSWETGKHKPDLDQFAILCTIYREGAMYLLTGKISPAKESLLEGLNQQGRVHALNYLSLLKSDPVFTKEGEKQVRTLRLYELPVSAGTGMYLDSDYYEELTVDESAPLDADYAVRVKGNSMEPKFHDGQILYIKEQETLHDGEIGIFSLNGEAYVKKLAAGTLVSFNPKYKPILLKESDEFRVFGKVIGKA